jgi:hypothetical protein
MSRSLRPGTVRLGRRLSLWRSLHIWRNGFADGSWRRWLTREAILGPEVLFPERSRRHPEHAAAACAHEGLSGEVRLAPANYRALRISDPTELSSHFRVSTPAVCPHGQLRSNPEARRVGATRARRVPLRAHPHRLAGTPLQILRGEALLSRFPPSVSSLVRPETARP